MDFLDPKKRKAHRVKLFIGYALVGIALACASVILLYQSYGYDFNPRTGEIVQNGLLFVDAGPDGAKVYLNGESRGGTDLRLDVSAGEYMLELQQDGYRTWKRPFTLEGGSIERFLYPFLFPTDLETSDVQNFSAVPGLMTQSPNRERLLVQQPGSYLRFDLLEIADETAETSVVNLPSTLLTAAGATHELSLVEWANDNRRVILRHRHDAGIEFVMVDIESPASSRNLTQAFASTAFSSLTLRDKKYDLYYLYNATTQELYSARLNDGTASLYQANVLAYKSYGANDMAFITTAGVSEGKAALKMREGDDVYTVRELATGSRYLVDVTRFEDSWYIAGGVAEGKKVYLYKNPVASIKRGRNKLPLPVAVLRTPEAVEVISFSNNTRFLAAQSGNDFAVYDADTDRQFRYDSGLTLAAGQRIEWMDGHRLAAVVGDKTVIFDYDGTNQQTLTAALANSRPFFDDDYEALFTLSNAVKGDGSPALVRTELRVE